MPAPQTRPVLSCLVLSCPVLSCAPMCRRHAELPAPCITVCMLNTIRSHLSLHLHSSDRVMLAQMADARRVVFEVLIFFLHWRHAVPWFLYGASGSAD